MSYLSAEIGTDPDKMGFSSRFLAGLHMDNKDTIEVDVVNPQGTGAFMGESLHPYGNDFFPTPPHTSQEEATIPSTPDSTVYNYKYLKEQGPPDYSHTHERTNERGLMHTDGTVNDREVCVRLHDVEDGITAAQRSLFGIRAESEKRAELQQKLGASFQNLEQVLGELGMNTFDLLIASRVEHGKDRSEVLGELLEQLRPREVANEASVPVRDPVSQDTEHVSHVAESTGY